VDPVVHQEEIMIWELAVQGVTITLKLSVERRGTLIQLRALSQFIPYVQEEHHLVLVVVLVIETVDTDVHLG
jgi:hypothetical protein